MSDEQDIENNDREGSQDALVESEQSNNQITDDQNLNETTQSDGPNAALASDQNMADKEPTQEIIEQIAAVEEQVQNIESAAATATNEEMVEQIEQVVLEIPGEISGTESGFLPLDEADRQYCRANSKGPSGSAVVDISSIASGTPVSIDSNTIVAFRIGSNLNLSFEVSFTSLEANAKIQLCILTSGSSTLALSSTVNILSLFQDAGGSSTTTIDLNHQASVENITLVGKGTPEINLNNAFSCDLVQGSFGSSSTGTCNGLLLSSL